MMYSRFGTYLILFICVANICFADVTDELQGINKEIKEKKHLLKKTKKEENQVNNEISRIEKSLHDKSASLAILNHDMQNVETQLVRTQKEILAVRGEAERKKQQIRIRLSALYKGGELGPVRIFFSSESFPQMTENMRYMKSILENDRKLFEEYNGKLNRLGHLKGSLEHDAARKEKLKTSIESKKREIELEKQKQASYLAKVRLEKKGYLASLKELHANARRLQVMVEKLEAKNRKNYTSKGRKIIRNEAVLPPVEDKGFGSQKGRLMMPVRGEITAAFGRHKLPEFNAYTVSNGISVAASSGTDIHSVYEGQVIFADYFKGYGNMVIIDHGGGFFSLYAHAAKIMKKVGAKVVRNEVVATVGDSDSTRGAMLYFEIRYQGKPVDPSVWVR
jgi:murein hydrolase activator